MLEIIIDWDYGNIKAQTILRVTEVHDCLIDYFSQMYNLKWLPLNQVKCPLHLGLILAPRRHLTKWAPLSRWRLSTLGSIVWVPPPQLKFNRSHKEWYICVGLLKWFITLAVCRVDKLPLEMFGERMSELWGIKRWGKEMNRKREEQTEKERRRKRHSVDIVKSLSEGICCCRYIWLKFIRPESN